MPPLQPQAHNRHPSPIIQSQIPRAVLSSLKPSFSPDEGFNTVNRIKATPYGNRRRKRRARRIHVDVNKWEVIKVDPRSLLLLIFLSLFSQLLRLTSPESLLSIKKHPFLHYTIFEKISGARKTNSSYVSREWQQWATSKQRNKVPTTRCPQEPPPVPLLGTTRTFASNNPCLDTVVNCLSRLLSFQLI